MLGISNDVWEAVATIVGAGATVGGPVVGWAFSVVKAKHVEELKGVRESATAQVNAAKAEAAASIKELTRDIAQARKEQHDAEMSGAKQDELNAASLKAAWVVLDDLRFNAVRKADQDKFREEVRGDMKALGDRLEGAITALRDDIHRDRPSGGA